MGLNPPQVNEINEPSVSAAAGKIRINRAKLLVWGTWIVVLILFGWYARQIAVIGLDARADLWDYWRPYRVEDIQYAMVHSDAALRNAEQLSGEGQANLPAGGATIADPGPGLFDPPVNLRNFFQRWRRLRPVYGQIIRGWIDDYDNPQSDPSPEGMDYPPLRLLTMIFWTWHVQSEFPGLNRFPNEPQQIYDPATGSNRWVTDEIAAPVLNMNTACTAVAALAVLILVWVWVQRGDSASPGEWGDPLLLIPVAALILCAILRPFITWTMILPTNQDLPPIDARVTSLAWWLFVILRFTSAVALARLLPSPFRGLACGVVAATLLWLNPTVILDSHGWPQWDPWLLMFFFLAALLVSVNWWLTAGLLIGVGCMFKGQILFAAPVLILCPLLAGWPIRCLRIVTSTAVGMGVSVWPWLVTSAYAANFIFGAVLAAVMVVGMSFFRAEIAGHFRELRLWLIEKISGVMAHVKTKAKNPHPDPLPEYRERGKEPSRRTWMIGGGCLVAMIVAAGLVLRIYGELELWPRIALLLLCAAILTLPWFMPRRMIGAWLMFVFAASLWLAAFNLGGKFSWWNVGFAYGTMKHNAMELGSRTQSSLGAILNERYGWQVHSPVGTIQTPLASGPIDVDLRQFMGGVFFLTVFICAIAAAIHLRRGDPHFLIALAAPWVIFPAILTQMSARYFMLPAAMTVTMVGISVRMSLWHLLLTVIGCVTLLARQWLLHPQEIAPITYQIIRPMHPDMGWVLVAIAGVFLVSAITPGRRGMGGNRWLLWKNRIRRASSPATLVPAQSLLPDSVSPHTDSVPQSLPKSVVS